MEYKLLKKTFCGNICISKNGCPRLMEIFLIWLKILNIIGFKKKRKRHDVNKETKGKKNERI